MTLVFGRLLPLERGPLISLLISVGALSTLGLREDGRLFAVGALVLAFGGGAALDRVDVIQN